VTGVVETDEHVVQTYHDTMHKLCLMSAVELQQIFGPLYQLLPLHEGHYIDMFMSVKNIDIECQFISLWQ